MLPRARDVRNERLEVLSGPGTLHVDDRFQMSTMLSGFPQADMPSPHEIFTVRKSQDKDNLFLPPLDVKYQKEETKSKK